MKFLRSAAAAFCALCAWVLVKSKVIRDKDKTK